MSKEIKKLLKEGDVKFTVKGITTYCKGDDGEYGMNPKVFSVNKDASAINCDWSGMNVTKWGPTCVTLYTFDILGKKIIETSPNNIKSVLNLTSLENGIYIVKVSFEKTVETFRVLKN